MDQALLFFFLAVTKKSVAPDDWRGVAFAGNGGFPEDVLVALHSVGMFFSRLVPSPRGRAMGQFSAERLRLRMSRASRAENRMGAV